MTPFDGNMVLLVFLLFCRIGGCLMFMPGFSSSRIPVQPRLFMAVATTLALTPLLLPTVSQEVGTITFERGFLLMLTEITIGSLIGLMGRMFFLALSFIGVAIASFSGFSNLPGIPLDSAEPNPTLSAMLTLTATVLFFIADLHWEVLRGLLRSYSVLPVTGGYDSRFGLVQMTDATTKAFLLATQISGPFMIFSVGLNFLFGIMNKFTPQIAVYFVSLPFLVFGGLIIIYFTVGEFLMVFINGFTAWLING